MFKWLFSKTPKLPSRMEVNYSNLVEGDPFNRNIKAKIRSKHPEWTYARIDNAIRDYRDFLYDAATSSFPQIPTTDVDAVWHEHILFTKDYFERWTKILGKTIHHNPDKIDDKKSSQESFMKKQKFLSKVPVSIPPKSASKTKKKNVLSSIKNSVPIKSTNIGGSDNSPIDGFVDLLMLDALIHNDTSVPDCSPSYDAPASSSDSDSSSGSSCSSSDSGSSCSSSSCSSSGGD
jgi:hypothetical protein